MTDAKPVHRIAVANQKGGVGKTTTAVSIAGELAARGEHVLLVDSDPQGNATTCLGISKRHLRATTYDVLIGAARIDDARLSTGRVGLDLLPANDDLAGAMIELAHVERRDYRLRDALQSISAYSYIVIDSPPSLGLLTINEVSGAADPPPRPGGRGVRRGAVGLQRQSGPLESKEWRKEGLETEEWQREALETEAWRKVTRCQSPWQTDIRGRVPFRQMEA